MTLPFDLTVDLGVDGATFAVTTGLTGVFGVTIGCGLTVCDLTTGAGLETTGFFSSDLATGIGLTTGAGLTTGIGLAMVAGFAFTTGLLTGIGLAAGIGFATGAVLTVAAGAGFTIGFTSVFGMEVTGLVVSVLGGMVLGICRSLSLDDFPESIAG